MRVYVPTTVPVLAVWLAAGETPAHAVACAVTPTLREWYRDGDLEELEYAATMDAARASLRMLSDDPGAPRRRVVVAIDVPDDAVRPVPDGRSSVAVAAAVPLARWASALVDDEDAEAAVSAAATVLPMAEAGDDDAAFTVDEADAHELQWWAVQELPHLISGDG